MLTLTNSMLLQWFLEQQKPEVVEVNVKFTLPNVLCIYIASIHNSYVCIIINYVHDLKVGWVHEDELNLSARRWCLWQVKVKSHSYNGSTELFGLLQGLCQCCVSVAVLFVSPSGLLMRRLLYLLPVCLAFFGTVVLSLLLVLTVGVKTFHG